MALHSSNTVKNYNILTKLVFGFLHIIEKGLLLFFELLIRLFSILGVSTLEEKKKQLIKEDFENWANFVHKKNEDNQEKGNLKQGKSSSVITGLLNDFLQPKPLTERQRSKIEAIQGNEEEKGKGKDDSQQQNDNKDKIN